MSNEQDLFEVGDIAEWREGSGTGLLTKEAGPGPFVISFVTPAARYCTHPGAPHKMLASGNVAEGCDKLSTPSHPQVVVINDPTTLELAGQRSGSHLRKAGHDDKLAQRLKRT